VHRITDSLSGHARGAGMRRMRLGDDRAAGGKGRGGVAAGYRKGERKVACAEYCNRA
jgi:hypothetical protein